MKSGRVVCLKNLMIRMMMEQKSQAPVLVHSAVAYVTLKTPLIQVIASTMEAIQTYAAIRRVLTGNQVGQSKQIGISAVAW